ncbi:Ubiquinone biosynthesis protein COQ4-like protein [Diplonema papillatum]|nr:Ubiquinone biosynthesis protein COQ4-like protein [Diplonema papillatum]
MYPCHINTNCFQKGLLSLGSAIGATFDPWRRADLVATLGETTGVGALQAMRSKLKETKEGRRVLFERPRIHTNELVEKLQNTAPEGSFGKAYSDWMRAHHFSPQERPQVRFVDDEELAYVMLRYRETHDIAHALSGLPPSIVGEMVLKSFEWHQTGLPMCGLASLAGAVHLNTAELAYFVEKGLPWARTAGQGDLISGVMWEDLWNEPIEDLRARLLIPEAPTPPIPDDSDA